jgi:predicted kinase
VAKQHKYAAAQQGQGMNSGGEGKEAGILYLIQGFLGAGKTTWSRELARRTGTLRFNADEWCLDNYTSEELDARWEACFAAAVAELWRQAARELSRGQDVILDFGFWTRASRDHARQAARALNARIVHYYIYAPDAALKERIAARKGAVAERNFARFEEFRRGFEEPAPEENAIVINNF